MALRMPSDHTGTDCMQFLTDTLQNNPKDRIHLLKIEKQLTDLVKDSNRNQIKFGPMSSYHRMLVHRVAAFFSMDHNVTNVDNSVIVSKTPTTRLPEFKFSDLIKNTPPEPEIIEPVRSIIKRDSSSLDKLSEKGYLKDRSPDRRGNSNSRSLVNTRRSKSLEEREEEYEKARARIFNQDSTTTTSSSENSLRTFPTQQVQPPPLIPSFHNQTKQTNRVPNVPFNVTAVSGIPASIIPPQPQQQLQQQPPSSSSGSVTVRQASIVTGTGPQIPPSSNGFNGMMNHSQSYPFAINHISLPHGRSNGGQLATTTNFTYAPSMQVPPTIPMYINTNGGPFAPNQLTGARPMPPPHQAQIIPSHYSPQAPVYRPAPLFFIFNFQNKRSN